MDEFNRRQWLATGAVRAGLATLATALPLRSLARDFPSRPIKILVGNSAGGTTDAIARLYGLKLSELLGTPVIIENKPGGFQLPAVRGLLASAPNGYTLLMGNGSSLSLIPAVRKDVGYAPLKDFSFVGQVGILSGAFVVTADLPVRSLRELVAYSIANPDKINYGSAGEGAGNHLKVEYFKALTGMRARHIPYKSDTEILREMLAGTVHLSLIALRTAQPLVQAGRLRALAVTAPHSLSYLPGVPGTAQSGFEGLEALEPYTYFGLVGPSGMPASVVTKINEAINKVSEMPDVKARMREVFFVEPSTSTPASFRELTQKELGRAAEIGKRIRLRD